MLKAGYVIEGDEVFSVSVSLTFKDIIKELENENNRGRYGLFGKLQDQIATAIANEFLLRHTEDILGAIDPRKVANMATLAALDRISK